MSTNSNEADLSLIVKAGAVVFAGVIVPGLLSRFLHEVGLGNIATFVFGMGFFGVVIVVWYIWIRPLDLTGPMG